MKRSCNVAVIWAIYDKKKKTIVNIGRRVHVASITVERLFMLSNWQLNIVGVKRKIMIFIFGDIQKQVI